MHNNIMQAIGDKIPFIQFFSFLTSGWVLTQIDYMYEAYQLQMSNVKCAESIFFSIPRFQPFKIQLNGKYMTFPISIQFCLPNSILVCHMNFPSFDRQT